MKMFGIGIGIGIVVMCASIPIPTPTFPVVVLFSEQDKRGGHEKLPVWASVARRIDENQSDPLAWPHGNAI